MGMLFLWWGFASAMAFGSTDFHEPLPGKCGELVAGANFVLTGYESVVVTEDNDGSYSIFLFKDANTYLLIAQYTPNPTKGGYDIKTYPGATKLPEWSARPPVSTDNIRRANQIRHQLNDTDILSSLEEERQSDLLSSLKSLFDIENKAIESHFESFNDRLRVTDLVDEWELGASIEAAHSKKAEEIARQGFIALGEKASTKEQRRRLLLETPSKKLVFDKSNEALKNLKTLIRAYHLMEQYHFREEAEQAIDRILKNIP